MMGKDTQSTLDIRVDRHDLINMIKGMPINFNGTLFSSVCVGGQQVPYVLRVINSTRSVVWNPKAFEAELVDLYTFYLKLKGVDTGATPVARPVEHESNKLKVPMSAALSQAVHLLNKSVLGQDFRLNIVQNPMRMTVVFQDLIIVHTSDVHVDYPAYADTTLLHVCSDVKRVLLTGTDVTTYERLMKHITKITDGRISAND